MLGILGGNHSKSDRRKECKGSNAGFAKDAVDAAGKRLLFDASIERRGHTPPLKTVVNIQMVKMSIGLECNKTNDFRTVFG